MEKFNYIISLGTRCITAEQLKVLNLRKFSSPFDWIAVNIDAISSCLNDDFTDYLDTSKYIPLYNNPSNNGTGHSVYGEAMFLHHNPMKNPDDYQYLIRCVKRFRHVLDAKEFKLFINTRIFFNDSIDLSYGAEVYEALKKKTNNFTFVVINACSNGQVYRQDDEKTYSHYIVYNINFGQADGSRFCDHNQTLKYQQLIISLGQFDPIMISDLPVD